MRTTRPTRPSVLMIAYTHYETDPRVTREARAAAEAGFDVDVIALRREGQPRVEIVAGVRLLRIQRRYRGASRFQYLLAYALFFAGCAAKSLLLFASKRYRVVHVNNMPDVLVWSVAPLKLFGARLILDIHDPMPETFTAKFTAAKKGWLYRLLLAAERSSVWLADRTLTVSDPVKTGVLLPHGYRPDAIEVVANFADDELFQPIPYPPVADKVRFVFHGTILERYGLGTLIDALTLASRRAQIAVRIVGEGDFSERLKALIDEHGLHDVVEFRNRMYPLAEIPGILSDCHVGLVPLKLSAVANYALPLKLVEYTCLGIPTVTIRNAAIEHYFRPDECVFFDAGDAQGLADCMDAIAADPGTLQRYRAKLAGARRRLLWSGEKAKYVALLRQLSGEPAVNAMPATEQAGR